MRSISSEFMSWIITLALALKSWLTFTCFILDFSISHRKVDIEGKFGEGSNYSLNLLLFSLEKQLFEL